MKSFALPILAAAAFALAAAPSRGQENSARPVQATEGNAPIYELRLVGNTITSISYNRHGSTEIGFQGTPLLAQAKGHARVENKNGELFISAEFEDLVPAQRFGNEYLTYVLWAITPEGKPSNLGELLLNGSKSKTETTTPLQAFGLMVSAEPYFAVTQPSNVVVLQNVVRHDTSGTIGQVNARYELLDRGQYKYNVAQENMDIEAKHKDPLEVYEARNAVAIAQAVGAQQYAPDALTKAQNALSNAEGRKVSERLRIQSAREAVQDAADARQITIRQREDQLQAREREASAQRQQQAQAEAQAATQQSQQAQAEAQAATQQSQRDQAARAQAEQQAADATRAQQQAQQQAEADAQARAQAQQQAQAAAEAQSQAQQQAEQQQAAAQQAQQQAEQARQQAAQLRASLLEQFNRILPTTDTPRGLKVNLADVLFDTAKYDLKEPAREALAKLSGIVLSHPGLKLQIEGFTDSTGTETFNQTLSENRAGAVRAFLIAQGVDPSSVSAVGYGESNPVASNDSAQGRQQNRRVEILISGEIIGTRIGGSGQPSSR
jgi:outer membrane protein OmpA-like peptidoglycan-associated protein